MSTNNRLDDLRDSIQSDEETSSAFDTLVSSLEIQPLERPLRSLLITSARPGEGKTTITLGLALTLAQTKNNVTIVDADVQRPTLHEFLGIARAPGLVDVLAGKLEPKDALQTARGSTAGRIHAVPSGETSAATIDWDPRMGLVIEVWKAMGAFVLVDSPPILSSSDALSLARLVDGVLIVVNTGGVTEKDATRTKQRLADAGARILGIVMNRFDAEHHGPTYHPYHRYYVRG